MLASLALPKRTDTPSGTARCLRMTNSEEREAGLRWPFSLDTRPMEISQDGPRLHSRTSRDANRILIGTGWFETVVKLFDELLTHFAKNVGFQRVDPARYFLNLSEMGTDRRGIAPERTSGLLIEDNAASYSRVRFTIF